MVTERAMQILYGSLLGDGGLYRSTINGPPQYKESHGNEQKEYVLWKWNALAELSPTPIRERTPYGWTKKPSFHFNIRTQPFFKELHNDFYALQGEYLYRVVQNDRKTYRGSNRLCGKYKKVIRPEVMQRINATGLAVFYMDDGCLVCANGLPSSIVLATNGYTIDEQRYIADWLRTGFGIESTIQNTERGCNLFVPRQATVKMIDIVKHEVETIPSMRYKLEFVPDFTLYSYLAPYVGSQWISRNLAVQMATDFHCTIFTAQRKIQQALRCGLMRRGRGIVHSRIFEVEWTKEGEACLKRI